MQCSEYTAQSLFWQLSFCVPFCAAQPVSEVTYIVSGEALNSTHLLTCAGQSLVTYSVWIRTRKRSLDAWLNLDGFLEVCC